MTTQAQMQAETDAHVTEYGHHPDCDVWNATCASEGPFGDPDIDPTDYECLDECDNPEVNEKRWEAYYMDNPPWPKITVDND